MRVYDMADIIHAKTGLSLAELRAMGSDARVEIIDGELVEMAAGGHVNGIIGATCIRLLGNYLEENPIGEVMQDATTYLMFSNQRRLRDSFVPDVSFIFHENVPPDWDPTENLHPGVPDLAIEIVSPTDNHDAVLRKRQIYLEKGTREVWLFYPGVQEIHQYSAQGIRIYSQPTDVIDASNLFPGLDTLSLAAIFRLPAWAVKKKDEDESEG